ncbi:MAG TPA: hypothetical protein VF054_14040 [Micromonosporaceae bacterium]
MTAEHVTTSPVELRFTPTAEDLLDGVEAQVSGFRRRWLVAFVAIVAVTGLVAAMSAERRTSTGDVVTVAVIYIALVVPALGVALLLGRYLRRPLYRWQVRLIMRGNPWLSQPVHAVVSEDGVHVRNAAAESTSTWVQYPLYTETDRSFVLLASRGRGAMALVLPKRGLVGQDPAALRAVLAAHCGQRP